MSFIEILLYFIGYIFISVIVSGALIRFYHVDDDDEPWPFAVGFLWPVTGTVTAIYCLMYLIFNPLFVFVSGSKKHKKVPKIVIEEGAEITSSEQYQKICELVKGFEEHMPVCERNDVKD